MRSAPSEYARVVVQLVDCNEPEVPEEPSAWAFSYACSKNDVKRERTGAKGLRVGEWQRGSCPT
jgi:hypothetical protein